MPRFRSSDSATSPLPIAARALSETSELTLRQLQIFWTVAHAGSLTKAAKQLAMRQPSVSQQIGRMESLIGGKLVRFVNNEMRLTPAGEFLLAEAGQILGAVDRAKAGLSEFFEGKRGRLAVGALPSLARNLLLPAFHRLMAGGGNYFLDIVETTPREAIEQLNGRMIDIALISGYAAVARLSPGLQPIPIAEDAQLLVVPDGFPDLSSMIAPEKELTPTDFTTLNRTVRFAFGSEHSNRIDLWYDRLLPHNIALARCRSYDSALPFVELGLGTALVPDLALQQQGRQLVKASLYEVPLPPRQTVALIPDHYARLPAFQLFLDVLRDVAQGMPRLATRPAPPFARARLTALV